MASTVRVITDSACDLPPALARERGIAIVPMGIRFGDELFRDRTDMGAAEFWTRLRTSDHLPETNPPLPVDFEHEIKEAQNDDASGVVIVTISSEISATYQSAILAAEGSTAHLPVKVVDSRTLSMAQGFAALAAADAAAAGLDVNQVALAASEAAAQSNVIAALDTLDYLKRGGRVGSAGAFFGDLFNLKPLLTMEEGVVAAAGRVRSRKAALDTVAEHVLGLPRLLELAVVQGESTDTEYLIEALAPRIDRARIVLADLGPVLATHTGPGVVGVAYRIR